MFDLVSVVSKDVISPVTQAQYRAVDKIHAIGSVDGFEHDCRKE